MFVPHAPWRVGVRSDVRDPCGGWYSTIRPHSSASRAAAGADLQRNQPGRCPTLGFQTSCSGRGSLVQPPMRLSAPTPQAAARGRWQQRGYDAHGKRHRRSGLQA